MVRIKLFLIKRSYLVFGAIVRIFYHILSIFEALLNLWGSGEDFDMKLDRITFFLMDSTEFLETRYPIKIWEV